jgi:SAM-dependent methyltransferase
VSALKERLTRRLARLATDAVTRRPWLWRLFRGPLRIRFGQLAPHWERLQGPDSLVPFEAALAGVGPVRGRVLDLGTGTGRAAFSLARRFPEAEILGVDLAPEMIEEARRRVPPEFAGRVGFETADGARLPYEDGAFQLVGLANAIPFWDELARVVAPGGAAVFGWSSGAATPIYVAPERVRRELGARGFTEFADFSAGRGHALLARKGGRA